MSKRSHFTTVTPLPAGVSRETVLDTLHNHTEMIDLNPLVIERHPIKPPSIAAPEEINCQWYEVSDKVSYIPGVYSGKLTFHACFHDLPDGMQSHIYAPMGLDMRGRWSVGGSLPGEPRQPVEMGLGLPKQGLYLREDVNMKCNFALTGFVRKTTKKTHTTLVQRLIEKSHVKEGDAYNKALNQQIELRNSYPPDYHTSQNGSAAASTATAPYYSDQKPPMQDHPSFSSAHGSTPSSHDPKQGYMSPGLSAQAPSPPESQYSYMQPAMGAPSPSMIPAPLNVPPYPSAQMHDQHLHTHPYQGYGQHPLQRTSGYGFPQQQAHAGAQDPAPPNMMPMVEMPAQEAATPVEIGSSAGAVPRR